MHVHRIYKTTFILMLIMLLSACASTTNKTVVLNTVASAEGPFFEGPNSLMAEYTVDVNGLLESEEYLLNDIEKVSIQDISVALIEEDSTSISDYASISMSIVSANEPLTGIATLNPIQSTTNSIKLSSSEEVDLAPFFKEGKFTFIVDWEFKSDDYRDQMSSKINMNLNLELLSK